MFEANKLYFTDDPALLAVWPYRTLAQWRSEGNGPAYIKTGKRIMYRGSDLNAFLDAHTVRPAPAPAA